MSSSNGDVDEEIIEQTRQETILKYRTFVDELYKKIASQNESLSLEESFSCLSDWKLTKASPVVCENENQIMQEHTNLIELSQTCGNSHLNKFMLVLASLTEELNELAKIGIQNFVAPILLYREDSVISSTKETAALDAKTFESSEQLVEDEFSAAASIVLILFDLICYLKRCYDVSTNLLLQKHKILFFSNIHKTKDKNLKSNLREVLPDLSSNLRFDIAWDALGSLAITLINLDSIFAQQLNFIRRDVVNYKRSLEMVLKNPSQFRMDSQTGNIQVLLTMIEEVERELFEGLIAGPLSTVGNDIEFLFLKGLVVSCINTNISENGEIVKNGLLNENLVTYLKQTCNDFEQNLINFFDDYRLLTVAPLYSIYLHLFWKESDKRLLKAIVDVAKKTGVHFVHLHGNVSLSVDQILSATLPKQLLEKKLLDSFATNRESLLKPGHVDSQVKMLNLQSTQWLVQVEQSFNAGHYSNTGANNMLKLITGHVAQIKAGVNLLHQLFRLVRNCIAAYYQHSRSLSKADSVALCKAIIIMKGIQLFFLRFKKIIIEVISHHQKYNSLLVLKILSKCKRKLSNKVVNQGYSVENMDHFSALILAANCLNGPVLTSKRYILTALCLAYAIPYPDLFTPEEITRSTALMREFNYFMKLFGKLSYMFNCDFLYFHREVVSVFFRHFYESTNKCNFHELKYFFLAIDDAVPMLQCSQGSNRPTRLVFTYLEDVYTMFKGQFLDPFCKDFEDELRFLTHLDLQVGEKNPYQRELKDFHSLLVAEPIKLGGGLRIIWIKSVVENYLNELAYNMTTIALHDWKTYESMLGFARAKFGLEFASLQLPTQTLEQGLDVLEITRNIHIFVAAYQYNLNNQFFVEKSSANKHLNVLTIRHVANSIQTHGFGIINSTVNFAYQFLKRKLQTLSQFMYEEHIKSRLIKDIRQFREMIAAEEGKGGRSATLVAKFPFEKAEKFVKGIRKLGSTKDGVTYLDKFRQLLTQIGNVLGFVRMLRSGALHCTSEIANFVPDLDDLGQISFECLVRQESANFGTQTVEAARNLDSVLQTVEANFSDATDYFKLLVEVFATTFRDSKYIHLKNFFVILPATTYNYVQHITICKEKLARKNKQEGAAFTDDGFAMGVVYVLKLLDQLADFDSLQWFGSVDDYVRHSMNGVEQIKLSGGQTNQPATDNLLHTTSLTIKRLQSFHRQFQLLKYGITSCRILFKTSG